MWSYTSTPSKCLNNVDRDKLTFTWVQYSQGTGLLDFVNRRNER